MAKMQSMNPHVPKIDSDAVGEEAMNFCSSDFEDMAAEPLLGAEAMKNASAEYDKTRNANVINKLDGKQIS